MEQTYNKRIEYIDAMRGVSMILVVYFHIAAYVLWSYDVGYNDIIQRFRMPVFFFISGWLFFKPERVWNRQTVVNIVRKKTMLQIVPTLCFMLLYLYVFDYLEISSFGSDKKGYWFTFVLFEYFVIYILAEALLNRNRTTRGECRVFTLTIVLSVCALYYAQCYTRYSETFGIWKEVLGLLSFVKIRYIIFFWFGTFVKKHFEKFCQLTGNFYFTGGAIIIFVGLIVYPMPYSTKGLEYIAFLLAGISGIVIFFTYFRIHQEKVSKQTWIGRVLQLIGRRTLDIYLLHYFVLPCNLPNSCPWLLRLDSNSIIMLISLVLALWVIVLSLLMSSIIRLSPFLGRHLLGAKD